MKLNMKNRMLKKVLGMALILVMSLSCTLNVFATENSNNSAVITANSGIELYANNYPHSSVLNGLPVTTSWQTIASSTTGFNCTVWVGSYNTSNIGLNVTPSDIRMLGKSGNVVWELSGALRGNGSAGEFWCGSDVYKIQIRTQKGTGTAYAYGN